MDSGIIVNALHFISHTAVSTCNTLWPLIVTSYVLFVTKDVVGLVCHELHDHIKFRTLVKTKVYLVKNTMIIVFSFITIENVSCLQVLRTPM